MSACGIIGEIGWIGGKIKVGGGGADVGIAGRSLRSVRGGQETLSVVLTSRHSPGHPPVMLKHAVQLRAMLRSTARVSRALSLCAMFLYSMAWIAARPSRAQDLGPNVQYEPEVRAMIARANDGDAEAEYHVGEYYDDGSIFPRNNTKAIYWFTKSANQDYPWAEYFLGKFYEDGRSPARKDRAKAIQLYRKAAQLNEAEVFNTLGEVLFNGGHCSEAECSEAAANFLRSPDQGRSSERLGDMYARGVGVTKNVTEAVRWYERVAARGGRATFKLCAIYLDRHGSAYDPVRAAAWLEATTSPIMLEQAPDRAKSRMYLARLEPRLTDTQRAAAHSASEELVARYGFHLPPQPVLNTR